MLEAKEIIKKIKSKKTLDDEWYEIRDEIIKFLSEEHSEKEKKMFAPLGYLEVVTMMCNGLEAKKKNISR